MYKYGILLVFVAGISAMEQPNEGKQEVAALPEVLPVSFGGLTKTLFPKNGSSEERFRAQVLAGYLSRCKDKDFDAWAQFGSSWGIPKLGMKELLVFSTGRNFFHEPLARAQQDDIAIFRDALHGTQLFIGRGFGASVQPIGYLPTDIEVSFTDAHIPKISDDGKYAFCFGKNSGLYLIEIATFFTGKEVRPIAGTEDWNSSSCDISFADGSQVLLYNGTAVFMGSASEVAQHSVSKLSKIIDCRKADQKMHTQNNSVLHVFGGGGLLAFRHEKGSSACTIYTIANGTAQFLTKIERSQDNHLLCINTAFEAMSLVFSYLETEKLPDIISFSTDLSFKKLHPKSRTRNVIYSPNGTYIGFFNKDSGIFELSTVKDNGLKSEIVSLADEAPDYLRWDKSGIYYSNFRDSGIICWNNLPQLLGRYKKSITQKEVQKPGKRSMIDGEASDAKLQKPS